VLRPVNRHILVDYSPPQENADSGILLPDDYKPPTEDYVVVDVLAVSEDVSIRCSD
jgi:co-chaperonin GroES (HSP10)